jgi:hypothetical protein
MIDDGLICHVGSTLVVNHYIVSLCPVWVFVDSEMGLGRSVIGILDGDLAVDAGLDALGQYKLLFAIVVAATADDEEHFERFDFRLGKAEACEGTTDKEHGSDHTGEVITARNESIYQ